MATKRPLKPAATTDITDEWGIYDPAKAGMPALFARLGRPVLHAAPTSSRRERHRALRPDRSTEGVGMAIAEAQRRAGLAPLDEQPPVVGNPARALRLALRAQGAVNAVGRPALEPFMPLAPVAPPVPQPRVPDAVDALEVAGAAEPTPAVKKNVTRKAPAKGANVETDGVVAAAPPTGEGVPAARARARRSTARARARTPATDVAGPGAVTAPAPAALAPDALAADPPTHGPATAATATAARPVAVAPSPRRPRGPVPLAAWAHAVVEAKPEPRRDDKRGFWRGVFRIPTEVALVEYAHGARIHRLLIEAGDDHVPDFI